MKKSIRFLIVLLFTVGILLFSVWAGYLSYTSGLRTIRENAEQMSAVINSELTHMILDYLNEPCLLEEIHRNAILNEQIDFSNPKQRDRHFVETLKLFPRVINTYIGMADGKEYGARREDDQSYVVWNSNSSAQTLDYYQYDLEAGRQGYLKSLYQYDTRQRPPFIKGSELKKPGWSDIFLSATGRGLVITAVHPIYTQDKELIGVFGSSLLLNWLDEFLQSLNVTQNSSIFILGQDDILVASVNKAQRNSMQEAQEKENKPVRAEDSNNLLLIQCLGVLKEVQADRELNQPVSLKVDFNDERYFLHAYPIKARNNLQLLSLIIIPEKDLELPLHSLIERLAVITLLVCILGIVAGNVLAKYIVNPLIEVNQSAKKIAEGDFTARIEIHRQDEIGRLVSTVNEMSEKLEQYFNKLSDDRLRIKLLTAGLENSSQFVVILDADWHIWWVNEAAVKISGFTQTEVVGQDLQHYLSAQNGPHFIGRIKEAVASQGEWHGEIITVRKDGQEYVDEIMIVPVIDDTANAAYFLVVGQDITEKVKTREALAAALEARVRAEKVSSVGTMAAGISHEINQPLNAIRVISGGILYLLKQGEKIPAEEFTESIEQIASQTDRISNIIKHLRSFVQRDEKARIPCNVNMAVNLSLELIGKQLAAHDITVQQDLQTDVPSVLANPTGLEEILINLLVNAMQALDAAAKPNKTIVIRTYYNDRVVLEISDNGPGIDPAIKNDIFESFTSTKAKGDNLGLGLAIVHNIITSYQGAIEVSSNEWSGATFTIWLPALHTGGEEIIS